MPNDNEFTRRSDLERVIDAMAAEGVEFIVIGGQAETLMGSPRVTYDVDVCYSRAKLNYARLATALQKLNATLRGVPKDLPFILDAKTLEMGLNFTFDTTAGALDVLGYVEPIGEYQNLLHNAETYPLANGILVRSIGLDDLIRVKTTIKRFKDTESMFQLLAIKRIRDETRQG